MTLTFLRSISRTARRAVPTLLVLAAVWIAGMGSAHAELRQHDVWLFPEAVTVHGHRVDQLLWFIFWLTLAVFIVTQAVYVYFIVKYRHRKGVKAVYSHGNNFLEIVWTTIPAVVFLALAVSSDKLWLELRGEAPKNALSLDIVAYQFGFHVRNPGADEKLAKYSQLWMEKGSNNFGVDLKNPDPAGQDDYQSENLLTLPVGRPVNVILRSQDVIHAFYVPEFRMYQDIVPGREISWVWFTPEKAGHYALACNQLCGSGHYNMQAKIDVVPPEEYAKLVKQQSRAAKKKLEDANKPEAAATPATADAAPSAPATAVASANP